jgi:outer membrane protein TolC
MTIRISLLLLFALAPLTYFAASTLDFASILQATLRHSHDIRMSALDIDISRSSLKEARSAYFPTLSTRFNSQYTKDLTNTTSPQVTAIGETILVQNTFYQNSLSLNAALNLYDFGRREDRVLIAAKDIPLKEAVHAQSIRDTKIKALETYRDLLVLTTDLASKRHLLLLHKEVAIHREKLYHAGLTSKIDVSDDAIKVVKLIDEIDSLTLKVTSTLNDLSLLTGERYEPEGLEVTPFKEEEDMNDPAGFTLAASPEHTIYDLALKKKKAEINALKKEVFYPQFSLYSTYIYYGQDQDNYSGAYGDMRARNFYVGLAATIPLFDGFKNSAQIEKARTEMKRLKVEKEKKLAELANRYEKLHEQRRVLKKILGNQQEIMTKTEEGTQMTSRLAERKIVEYIDLLKRKIEATIQTHELTRARITKTAAALALRMLVN